MAISRKSAILKAREYLAVRPVFLDTETTGLDPSAEIVEISVVDQDGKIILDTLVKPTRQIPADAIRIHGITDEMVKNAPTWPEVWTNVTQAVTGRYIGIYNADFDLRMVRQSHLVYGINGGLQTARIFDVMKLYADFIGSTRWVTLDVACRRSGIPIPNTHRAREDTLLLRALLVHIAERMP